MITIIIALALAQASASPSDAEVCRVYTRLNAQMIPTLPRQLDAVTRVDSVDLSCPGRSLLFHKTLLVPESRMRPGWRDEAQAEFNRMICSDVQTRAIIRRGWRIGHVFALQDGSQVEQFVHC